ACPQRRAEGPVAEGEPRDPAAALRIGSKAEARLSAPRVRAERRLDDARCDRNAAHARGWRNGGAHRVSRAVAARAGRCALLRREVTGGIARRSDRLARALCRTRARARHVAARDRAPRPRPVSRRVGRATLSAHPLRCRALARRGCGAVGGRRPSLRLVTIATPPPPNSPPRFASNLTPAARRGCSAAR